MKKPEGKTGLRQGIKNSGFGWFQVEKSMNYMKKRYEVDMYTTVYFISLDLKREKWADHKSDMVTILLLTLM